MKSNQKVTTTPGLESAGLSREVRLAVTARCNYACFFCHREGQEAGYTTPATADRMLSLLRAECESGCKDVTLTGGEPLMERALVLRLISGLAAFPESVRPALTIVSNGSRWDSEIVETLARYPGPCKVNISLHSARPETYDRLTGTSGQLPNVLRCVCSLLRAGVEVKLNAVIARGMNSDASAYMAILQLAGDLGVQIVKFLELLAPCGGESQDPWFVGWQEVEGELLALGYRRECDVPRGIRLAPRSGSGPWVEIKRCSCSLGCKRCQDVLARNFGPDLEWQPCFQGNRGSGLEERRIA